MMRKFQSIPSLKSENKYLSSPKKCPTTILCGILTKSPVKKTSQGKMFAMRLCDANPSINTRAVCYDRSKYDLFEAKKTYEINQFKLKKGYGNTNELEVVIDDDTEIKESLSQFNIEKCSFEIGQLVRGETANVRYINIKGKVVDIGDVMTVGKFPDLKEKRDIQLADKSGHITLVLWRDRAKQIDFALGDVLSIGNCVVSTFNKVHNITTAFETSITKVEEILEVPTTPTLKPKPDAVIQVVAQVTAFKDLTTKVKCTNCSKEIEIDTTTKETTSGCVVKCSKCYTVFMAKWSAIFKECKFQIQGSWYIARKGVLGAFFGETKRTPTDEQIVKLLCSSYTVRLNTESRKIEHACPIDEDEESQDTDLLESGAVMDFQNNKEKLD